jgi:hypothetical protein
MLTGKPLHIPTLVILGGRKMAHVVTEDEILKQPFLLYLAQVFVLFLPLLRIKQELNEVAG